MALAQHWTLERRMFLRSPQPRLICLLTGGLLPRSNQQCLEARIFAQRFEIEVLFQPLPLLASQDVLHREFQVAERFIALAIERQNFGKFKCRKGSIRMSYAEYPAPRIQRFPVNLLRFGISPFEFQGLAQSHLRS